MACCSRVASSLLPHLADRSGHLANRPAACHARESKGWGPVGDAGAQDDLYDLADLVFAEQIRAEAQDVAVVVLARPAAGDLLTLRDTGAYGYAMSSNYNSIGRAPQLWLEEDGSVEMISRRETIDDLLKAETSERVQ